jgi:hypothetical protein
MGLKGKDMAGHDHSIPGELRTLGEKSVVALTGIQPGEEREVDLDPGLIYLHLPEADGTIVGIDVVKVVYRRPDK